MNIEGKYRDLVLIFLLSLATFWLSLMWFPRTTPDSDKYLLLVEIFKGTVPPSEAISPFCYRPLMAFIVALFPTDPLLTWAFLSAVLNTLIVPVVYLMIREFDIGSAGAFTGTGLTTIGYMTISVGSWVVTDISAMLFLALALLGILRNTNKTVIISLLVIGTLFKEFVILGAIVWFLYSVVKSSISNVFYSIVAGSLCFTVYMLVRAFWTSIGVSTYMWKWLGWYNFEAQPEGVLYSFWLSLIFFIPAIILAVIVGYKTKASQFRKTLIWLGVCTPLLIYLGMGLFMAYFGMRFIWPIYLGMAPLAAIFGDWFFSKLYDITKNIYTAMFAQKKIQWGK